jgi:hypothetical protein
MHHQQQRLLTPCGHISSGGIEARRTPGATAGTPAAGLLVDSLKLDLHNFNEGRSTSNHCGQLHHEFIGCPAVEAQLHK